MSRLELDDPLLPGAGAPGPEDAWPDLDEMTCLRLGDEQFQQGLYELALGSYSRSLRFNKDLAPAWVGQVRCLLCLGEYPEAVTWSDRGLERFRDSADLLACKGLALVLAGRPSEGMEYLDGAVESRSPSSWVWLARGQGLLSTGQPPQNASRCFLKALEMAAEDWTVELRVGMAYNRSRLFPQARAVLLQAVRKAPDHPMVLFHLGVTFEGLGERSAALGYYQRAAAARREFTEAEEALRRLKPAGLLGRFRR